MTQQYEVSDGTSTEIIEADSIELLESMIRDWVGNGDWGEGGCVVTVHYGPEGEGHWDGSIDVEIPQKEDELIRDAALEADIDDYCGDDPDDHTWISSVDVEGGIEENPGVWSLGGTKTLVAQHCKHCGLQREITYYGSQRNPWEPSEEASYEFPPNCA